jgi:hypothetical protein
MMDSVNAQWREFDGLGIEEVRKQRAGQINGESPDARAIREPVRL